MPGKSEQDCGVRESKLLKLRSATGFLMENDVHEEIDTPAMGMNKSQDIGYSAERIKSLEMSVLQEWKGENGLGATPGRERDVDDQPAKHVSETNKFKTPENSRFGMIRQEASVSQEEQEKGSNASAEKCLSAERAFEEDFKTPPNISEMTKSLEKLDIFATKPDIYFEVKALDAEEQKASEQSSVLSEESPVGSKAASEESPVSSKAASEDPKTPTPEGASVTNEADQSEIDGSSEMASQPVRRSMGVGAVRVVVDEENSPTRTLAPKTDEHFEDPTTPAPKGVSVTSEADRAEIDSSSEMTNEPVRKSMGGGAVRVVVDEESSPPRTLAPKRDEHFEDPITPTPDGVSVTSEADQSEIDGSSEMASQPVRKSMGGGAVRVVVDEESSPPRTLAPKRDEHFEDPTTPAPEGVSVTSEADQSEINGSPEMANEPVRKSMGDGAGRVVVDEESSPPRTLVPKKDKYAEGLLTVPKSPNLQTRSRVKRSAEEQPAATTSLRMPPQRVEAHIPRSVRDLTVPESPFLSTRSRPQRAAGATELQKTPQRPRNTELQKTPQRPRNTELQKTPQQPRRRTANLGPLEPKLQVTSRQRVRVIKSFEEMQLESIQKAKKKFELLKQKTQQAYQRMITSLGASRVPRPQAFKRVTETESPQLRTNRRAIERKEFGVTKNSADAENLPRSKLPRAPTRAAQPKKEDVGDKNRDRKAPVLTDPHTPQLRTKSRAAERPQQSPVEKSPGVNKENTRRWNGSTLPVTPKLSCYNGGSRKRAAEIADSEHEKDKPYVFKARPMPRLHNHNSISIPKNPPEITVPVPFRLSAPNRKVRSTSTAALSKSRPKQQHRVKAPPRQASEIESRVPTQPKPFKLRSEQLHKMSKDEFEMTIEQKEAEEMEKRSFRARPMPDLSRIWKPEASNRASLATLPIDFATEKRAEERSIMELKKREEEESLEEEHARARDEDERSRKQELKEYRKSLVFKARPIGIKAWEQDQAS